MTADIAVSDFAGFFHEVHGHPPFPWQARLSRLVAETSEWPPVLDLPTGSGKTAGLDIAVFHLALEAERGGDRRAPVRIAFVVDRRLVVDDAHTRAMTIGSALETPRGPVTERVAARLAALSHERIPLVVSRLRGGIPRQDDWARTPSQPTILCSTVDQVGSRLLFRGYGVSDRMKPLHAGLLGSDCLLLLDEAHLAEPFRQTLRWVKTYRGDRWREEGIAGAWGATLLTATPREEATTPFGLDDEDYRNPVLAARWRASKPARLAGAAKKTRSAEPEEGGAEVGDEAERMRIVTRILDEVRAALAALRKEGGGTVDAPAIGVVVNRVARARAVHRRLAAELAAEIGKCILLIGPARPVDRDDLAEELREIRTGAARALDKPLVIVATQCIEAGVDIDLDALITEMAPLDALRQRFGRLNRAGREIKPFAAIVASPSVLSPRHDDPVYGTAIKPAWDYLAAAASAKDGTAIVDFGLASFADLMKRTPIPDTARAPKADAPMLLPAHLDLLSQTAPIPAADPEVALYLHGPDRQPDAVTVVWRADLEPLSDDGRDEDERVRRLLMLVPPRTGEAIELPVWAVRNWLEGDDTGRNRLADISMSGPEFTQAQQSGGARVFLWKGDDDRSCWIAPRAVEPGCTIVVPARYGGVDEFGWRPDSEEPADDVASKAARHFAGRRFAVRVAPGLLRIPIPAEPGETREAVAERRRREQREAGLRAEELADALAAADPKRWADLRDAIKRIDLPQEVAEQLDDLDRATPPKRKVEVHMDIYGFDDRGRPRGVVFVAPRGIEGGDEREDGRPGATEDDAAGSMPGFTQTLDEHSGQVESVTRLFAERAALPAARVADLALAGYLHDAGKADPRFQVLLYCGDPLGPDPDQVLAKSARPLPRDARERSGLPDNWRHESLSVRLAAMHPRFDAAADPELVLWLIGTHHGYGRPLFPHADPLDAEARTLSVLGQSIALPPGAGPQSLAYDRNGNDWAALFERLKARYGVWELARMEAILRLADHRASEKAERDVSEGDAA